MRIISGSFRSRTLQAPPGLATRPTSDRLRETLFNVLAPRIEGAVFLDLYSGSGERAPAALKVLDANLVKLGLTAGFRVYSASVGAFLRKAGRGAEAGFDVAFLDPPYDAAQEYAATLGLLGGSGTGLLAAGALVIAEHRRKERLADSYGSLERTRLLEQGDASLSFYAFRTAEASE
jgi:16S rRNA G966 N2-methylase RsmD